MTLPHAGVIFPPLPCTFADIARDSVRTKKHVNVALAVNVQNAFRQLFTSDGFDEGLGRGRQVPLAKLVGAVEIVVRKLVSEFPEALVG
jgi:hypothetical protein